jgi:hypothetical protein
MVSPYQAFPLLRTTVVGVLTNQPLSNTQHILHANVDTDLTLTFPDTSTSTFSITQGVDVVLDGGALTVSTTAECMLS